MRTLLGSVRGVRENLAPSLVQVDTPRNEDIECLCKLMATIGGQIEASLKSAGYMDMYCRRMLAIKSLPHLEVGPGCQSGLVLVHAAKGFRLKYQRS